MPRRDFIAVAIAALAVPSVAGAATTQDVNSALQNALNGKTQQPTDGNAQAVTGAGTKNQTPVDPALAALLAKLGQQLSGTQAPVLIGKGPIMTPPPILTPLTQPRGGQ